MVTGYYGEVNGRLKRVKAAEIIGQTLQGRIQVEYSRESRCTKGQSHEGISRVGRCCWQTHVRELIGEDNGYDERIGGRVKGVLASE